jgi:pentatricopeptide repeat protein
MKVDRAIEHVQTSLRLSPRIRAGWAQSVMGGAHFFASRFDQAAAELRLAVQEEPSFVPAHRFLAACYAQMGRLEEAKRVVQLIRECGGDLLPRSYILAWRKPNHRQLFLSGLRLAAGDTALLARADEVIE